jgi:hypothetical protein
VSRLANLLNGGSPNSEQVGVGRTLLRQVRRHNAGRAALRLLRDHGGPDFTTDSPRAQARAVFSRAGTVLDDDAALDAELLDAANKGGGSLLRLHRHEIDEVPYASLGASITLASALRTVLGYTPTPVPCELIDAERKATTARPEWCPECEEIGLCAAGCAAATANDWPRDAKGGAHA